MKKQKGYTTAATLVIFAIAIAGLIGWILNIVAIVHTGFSDFNGMLIARCIGVFVAPLGAILGYC